MDRRAFISTLAGGLLTAPLAAEAQSAGKIQRVGVVFSGSREESLALIRAFEEGLQERGYVEGRNLGIEHRFAEGRADRVSAGDPALRPPEPRPPQGRGRQD